MFLFVSALDTCLWNTCVKLAVFGFPQLCIWFCPIFLSDPIFPVLLEWLPLSPLFTNELHLFSSYDHLLSCNVFLDEMVFNINLTNSLWLTLIPCTFHYHFFTSSSCVEHHCNSSIARIELSCLMWCVGLLEPFLGHSRAAEALAAVTHSFDSQNVISLTRSCWGNWDCLACRKRGSGLGKERKIRIFFLHGKKKKHLKYFTCWKTGVCLSSYDIL